MSASTRKKLLSGSIPTKSAGNRINMSRKLISDIHSGATRAEDVNDVVGKSGAREEILQKENETLKEENARLKEDLEAAKSLFTQLVDETSSEKYDERRVNLLKATVIQLERQVFIQSQTIAKNAESLDFLASTVEEALDKVKSIITDDHDNDVSNPQITATIIKRIKKDLEYCKGRLCKTVDESKGVNRNPNPFLFPDTYTTLKSFDQKLTLLDVTSGKIEHLNLKQVAHLESNLVVLYKKLIELQRSLSVLNPSKQSSENCSLLSEHVTRTYGDQINEQFDGVIKSLHEATHDLLSLSLLVPSAPWVPLRRAFPTRITPATVVSYLPFIPKNKRQIAISVISAVLKAVNYEILMKSIEHKSAIHEVKFHQAVYQIQLDYINSISTNIRNAYQEFEKKAIQNIIEPLNEVLRSFSELSDTVSGEALRNFIITFKSKTDKLYKATMAFESSNNGDSNSSGSEALSTYSKLFYENLDNLIKENANVRDQLADDLIRVKMERDSQSIEDLLADLSIKDDKISVAPKEDEKETEKARIASKLIPPGRSRKQNLESQKIANSRTHASSTANVTSESSEKNNLLSGPAAIKKLGHSRVSSALSKEKTNLRNDDRAPESNTASGKPKSNIKKQK